MSVAFRRDSDEEHLEPKFEIPIPPGPNLVTPRGLASIRSKVSEGEAALPGITDEVRLAAAKRDLRYWRARQATARLAPPPSGKTVEFGSRVTFLLKGKRRTITIVGDDEADPKADLIAFTAPLAKAMMQAEPGEVLPFGGEADAIEILEIAI